jgi:hypothetical protein
MKQNDAIAQERLVRMKYLMDKSYNLFSEHLAIVIDAQLQLHQLSEETDAFKSAFDKLEEKFSTLAKFDRLTGMLTCLIMI